MTNSEEEKKHKAGFVNIIGNPNTGKSTFLNKIIDFDLAITTPKAQTTRHRILGLWNDENHQIVFSDTPGIIQPAYEMQNLMMGEVKEALEDADIILLMTTPEDSELKDENILEVLKNTSLPVFVLINKIDQSSQEKVEEAVLKWKEKLPNAQIFPISALHGFGLDQVLTAIKEKLPYSPPYFDKDQITDKQERFLVSEKIREKILLHYKKEIPYAVEVVVEEFKESENLIKIRAVIYVERDTQKGIIIGHKGQAIKRIGMEARKDLEKIFGKKIHMELFVKVRKDWRKDPQWLKRFGYKKQ